MLRLRPLEAEMVLWIGAGRAGLQLRGGEQHAGAVHDGKDIADGRAW